MATINEINRASTLEKFKPGQTLRNRLIDVLKHFPVRSVSTILTDLEVNGLSFYEILIKGINGDYGPSIISPFKVFSEEYIKASSSKDFINSLSKFLTGDGNRNGKWLIL